MTELTCVYSAVRPESLNVLHSQYSSLKCFVPLLFRHVTLCPYQIYAGEQICITQTKIGNCYIWDSGSLPYIVCVFCYCPDSEGDGNIHNFIV